MTNEDSLDPQVFDHLDSMYKNPSKYFPPHYKETIKLLKLIDWRRWINRRHSFNDIRLLLPPACFQRNKSLLEEINEEWSESVVAGGVELHVPEMYRLNLNPAPAWEKTRITFLAYTLDNVLCQCGKIKKDPKYGSHTCDKRENQAFNKLRPGYVTALTKNVRALGDTIARCVQLMFLEMRKRFSAEFCQRAEYAEAERKWKEKRGTSGWTTKRSVWTEYKHIIRRYWEYFLFCLMCLENMSKINPIFPGLLHKGGYTPGEIKLLLITPENIGRKGLLKKYYTNWNKNKNFVIQEH